MVLIPATTRVGRVIDHAIGGRTAGFILLNSPSAGMDRRDYGGDHPHEERKTPRPPAYLRVPACRVGRDA